MNINNNNKLKLTKLNSEKCIEYLRNEHLKNKNDSIVDLTVTGKEDYTFYERDYYKINENTDFLFFSLKNDTSLQAPLNNFITESNLFFLKPYLYKYISSDETSKILYPTYNECESLFNFIFNFTHKAIFPEYCHSNHNIFLLEKLEFVLHQPDLDDSLLYLKLIFQFSKTFLQFLKYFQVKENYETSPKFYELFPHLAESVTRIINNDKRNTYVNDLMNGIIKCSNLEILKKDTSITNEYLKETERLINGTRINYQQIFESSEYFTNFSKKLRFDISQANMHSTAYEIFHNIKIN